MRVSYLLIAMAVLIAGSCKKNIKEVKAEEPGISVDAPVPCSGDKWEQVHNYIDRSLSPCLVYNNKAYFFIGV